MHIQLRVHRWVVWWFYIGLVLGIVALANIFSRNLTRSQEDLILILGVIHWVLGGVVCYSFDSIKIESPQRESKPVPARHHEEKEWYPASDFLQPGRRKRLLPR